MELTPLIRPGRQAADRQVIERYGAAGFRVSGQIYRTAVLVFPDRTQPWEAASMTVESLAPVIAYRGVELLLLGLGRRMQPVSAALRTALRQSGIAVEAMDTGAACRTYNVLLSEDRLVAAALLPPV